MAALPGEEMVDKGLADLERGEESIEALLVSIGRPRLERLGYRIPSPITSPEDRLYALLAEEDSDSAHSRYNALIRRLVSFERAAERAKSRTRPVDRAAERLCDATTRLLNHARQPVWGVEWDWEDEDPLRDAATQVEHYRHWVATGEDPFIALRPGLEPHLAMADGMLTAVAQLLRYWDGYGDPLDPAVLAEIDEALGEYRLAQETASTS